MLYCLQQSANLRIPSVDQAPELDVPLFEVLGIAIEDLQVLVPVKVVPLRASSVALRHDHFPPWIAPAGLAGTKRQLPPSSMAPAKTHGSAIMQNSF